MQINNPAYATFCGLGFSDIFFGAGNNYFQTLVKKKKRFESDMAECLDFNTMCQVDPVLPSWIKFEFITHSMKRTLT